MKTILSDSAQKPLTIEPYGDGILLQLHLNSIRFGKASAEWLLQALRKASHEKQVLRHEGVNILEVFYASGYAYIVGQKSRFTMNSTALQKLVQWLENHYPETIR